MSSNGKDKKDTDDSSNKSKSDVENQMTSPHSSITKNIKDQNYKNLKEKLIENFILNLKD